MKRISTLSLFLLVLSLPIPTAAAPQGPLAALLSILFVSTQSGWIHTYDPAEIASNTPLHFDMSYNHGRITTVGNHENGSFIAEQNSAGEIRWKEALPHEKISHLITMDNGDLHAYGKGQRSDEYGELTTFTELRFRAVKGSERPFFYAKKRATPAMLFDLHDVVQVAPQQAVALATVYGGFRPNTSYTHQPQVALFTWGGPLDPHLTAEAFAPPSKVNAAYKLIAKGPNNLYTIGWSAYPLPSHLSLPYKWIPALSMMTYHYNGTFHLIHPTRLFFIADSATQKRSWTEALAGVSFLLEEDGSYVATGTYLNFNPSLSNTTSHHFFATKFSNTSTPLWNTVHNISADNLSQSAGFDVIKARDGNYLFTLMEASHHVSKRARFLKLDQGSGAPLSSTKLSEENYTLIGRFSLHKEGPGKLFFTAKIIDLYNGSEINPRFLLAQWDEGHLGALTESPLQTLYSLPLTAVDLSMEQSTLYSLLETATIFIIDNRTNITDKRLYQAEISLPSEQKKDSDKIVLEVIGYTLLGGLALTVSCVWGYLCTKKGPAETCNDYYNPCNLCPLPGLGPISP